MVGIAPPAFPKLAKDLLVGVGLGGDGGLRIDPHPLCKPVRAF